MVEAVRTTASSGDLWVLVILMSLLTVILVSAPLVADSVQTRVVNRRRRLGILGEQVTPDATVTAETGAATAVGVAEPVPGNVPWQRTGEARGELQPDAQQGDIPTRSDLPAQRGGEGDQAEFNQAEFNQRGRGDRDQP